MGLTLQSNEQHEEILHGLKTNQIMTTGHKEYQTSLAPLSSDYYYKIQDTEAQTLSKQKETKLFSTLLLYYMSEIAVSIYSFLPTEEIIND